MIKCKYDVCWKGQCGNKTINNTGFCEEHLNKKCHACTKQAIGDCHKFNGSMICGYPMCDEHQHQNH